MTLKLFYKFENYGPKEYLRYLEIASLCLMLMALPSFEAPKNIFLVLYLIFSLYREFSLKNKNPWKLWDFIFLSYITSFFLGAIFAGISAANEWGGVRSALIWVGFCWLLSRSNYTPKEITLIIWITILSTLPPLSWGLFEYWNHSKNALQLHSVGHVNHTAIYLGIILGMTLSVSLSLWRSTNRIKKILFLILPVLFFIAIIICQSRGVFGVSFIRILLIILLIPNPKAIKIISYLLFLIILFFMPLMKANIIQKQITNQINHDVLSDRQRVWNVSIDAARFNPIFGIGNGNWKKITLSDIREFREKNHLSFDPSIYRIDAGHSHSLYLTSLVERGWVGLLCLFTFIFFWFKTLITTYSQFKKTRQGSYIWGSSFSSWIVTFGVGFVNTTLHHEHAILAFLTLGLHLSLINQNTKTNNKINN